MVSAASTFLGNGAGGVEHGVSAGLAWLPWTGASGGVSWSSSCEGTHGGSHDIWRTTHSKRFVSRFQNMGVVGMSAPKDAISRTRFSRVCTSSSKSRFVSTLALVALWYAAPLARPTSISIVLKWPRSRAALAQNSRSVHPRGGTCAAPILPWRSHRAGVAA